MSERTRSCRTWPLSPSLDAGKAGDVSAVSITAPAGAANLIGQLRASGAILTYDPDTCTIRSADSAAVAVTTGRSH